MDLRRLGMGDWVAGVGGLALLASLFAPWYSAAGRAPTGGEGWTAYAPIESATASGWEALAATDVLLALVAASGVALALITATQGVPAVPVALAAVVTLVGVVGLVLVLLRVLDVPDAYGGREWGLWLGLAGALGILAGGILAIRNQRWPADEARVEFVPAPRP
jgi:hypothetical protein